MRTPMFALIGMLLISLTASAQLPAGRQNPNSAFSPHENRYLLTYTDVINAFSEIYARGQLLMPAR